MTNSLALPNVTCLPASLGKTSFETLKLHGVISADQRYRQGEIYLLALTAVPACNRGRGKKATDWQALGAKQIESIRLGNHIKVLKARLDELDPDKEAKRPVTMSPEQQAFLAACGIKPDGTYAPPTEEQEPTDVLQIRTLEIKVAKTSSVSMKDFGAMLKDEKKMNLMGQWMKAGQDDFENNAPKTQAAAVTWLADRIEDLSKQKRALDAEVNAARFAIALGGHWAKHHREKEAAYDVGGHEVMFVFRDDVDRRI